MIKQLTIPAALVLLGAWLLVNKPSDQDVLMEKFLRLTAQERADFISANLTPEMLRLMSISPCEGEP